MSGSCKGDWCRSIITLGANGARVTRFSVLAFNAHHDLFGNFFQRATPVKPAVLHPDAMASVPRALTGLVYHYRSLPVARKFVHAFFLSREIDLRNLLKFRDPKLALSFTVEQFRRERPISRWVSFLLHAGGIHASGRRGVRAYP